MSETTLPQPNASQLRPAEASSQKNVIMAPKGPEALKIPGVHVMLREPRPEDPRELAGFNACENGPQMNEINETPEDIISPAEMPGWIASFAGEKRPETTMKVFTADETIAPGQQDVMQGWLRLDQGTPQEGSAYGTGVSQEKERYDRIMKEAGLTVSGSNLDPCELTVSLRPDGVRGVAEEAYVMAVFQSMTRDAAAGITEARPIVVFQEDPDPSNALTTEAWGALGKCGFKQVTTKEVGYDADSEPDTHLYELDRNAFMQKYGSRYPATPQVGNK